MNETEYLEFLEKHQERNKLLSSYEPFVYSKLDEFNDTSAAQMHDWLKERYPDFPKVSQKTIYNFVFWIREKYQDMNNINTSIKQLCLSLNLTSLSQDYEQIMQQAEQGQVGYRKLASMLLEYELEKHF
jgi:hypothetical protein